MAGESESGSNFFSRFTGLFRGKDNPPKPATPVTSQDFITEQTAPETPPPKKPVENALTDKMKKLAEETLAELGAIEGKKGLVVIIDDDPARIKIRTANLWLEGHTKSSDVNYVMRHFYEGDEGISFYVELRKVSLHIPVVILMDGNLSRGDTGARVNQRLLESTKQNHLSMPYIIGNSNEERNNSNIKRVAPDYYLGDFSHNEDETLTSFDSKL